MRHTRTGFSADRLLVVFFGMPGSKGSIYAVRKLMIDEGPRSEERFMGVKSTLYLTLTTVSKDSAPRQTDSGKRIDKYERTSRRHHRTDLSCLDCATLRISMEGAEHRASFCWPYRPPCPSPLTSFSPSPLPDQTVRLPCRIDLGGKTFPKPS